MLLGQNNTHRQKFWKKVFKCQNLDFFSKQKNYFNNFINYDKILFKIYIVKSIIVN